MGITSKKNKLLLGIGYLCLAFLLIRCDNNNLNAINNDDLLEMSNEITALSSSVDCKDSSDWSFTAIGSKACGGPSGYIAFSKQIDTVAFLEKVEKYTAAQKRYNQENDVISDCALEAVPLGLICVDDEAVLIYNRCGLIPDPGICNAAFRKYYFDQETQECKEFMWGGCKGIVPFDTLEECRECE